MTRSFAFIASVAVAAALALLLLEARTDFDMPGDSTNASASVDADTKETPLGCHSASGPATATRSPEVSAEPQNNTGIAISFAGPEDMRLIHGGRFQMGTDDGLPVEAPVHQVLVKDFWMDRHPVTVGEFTEFIRITRYK